MRPKRVGAKMRSCISPGYRFGSGSDFCSCLLYDGEMIVHGAKRRVVGVRKAAVQTNWPLSLGPD